MGKCVNFHAKPTRSNLALPPRSGPPKACIRRQSLAYFRLNKQGSADFAKPHKLAQHAFNLNSLEQQK